MLADLFTSMLAAVIALLSIISVFALTIAIGRYYPAAALIFIVFAFITLVHFSLTH